MKFRTSAFFPVSFLLAILLPLLFMPLASIFVFAGRSGLDGFWTALHTPDAQFSLRFSLLIAGGTALVNSIILGKLMEKLLQMCRVIRGTRSVANVTP